MQKAEPLPNLDPKATVADLIDNDILVVGAYRELAKRHAELVDFVNGLINKQAAQ